MNPLLTQLPTLLGVIVGAGASYLTTSAGAKTQWARTQQARWEDKRSQAYADYADASTRVDDLTHRIARTRGLPTNSGPLPLKNGLDDLTKASNERNRLWHRLQLIGDPATVNAGLEWRNAVWRLERFARGEHGYSDPEQWTQATHEAGKAQFLFYEAARRDLRIDSGSLPADRDVVSLSLFANYCAARVGSRTARPCQMSICPAGSNPLNLSRLTGRQRAAVVRSLAG